LILSTGLFADRSVLDVGCGDGSFTVLFWERGRPTAMTAVDAAAEAVLRAQGRAAGRPIRFAVADAHHLPFADDTFDLVLLQSILHHDEDPLATLREGLRLAPRLLIHEPNGSNLGLKIIERVSPYHRAHREKSFSVQQLTRLIRQAGGRAEYHRYAGFVPMFSPDWLARIMKALEPVVEWLPGLRKLACAVYILAVAREE
jgi:ubiquinone/menaquinone biosynthesis C-methylase UbiE